MINKYITYTHYEIDEIGNNAYLMTLYKDEKEYREYAYAPNYTTAVKRLTTILRRKYIKVEKMNDENNDGMNVRTGTAKTVSRSTDPEQQGYKFSALNLIVAVETVSEDEGNYKATVYSAEVFKKDESESALTTSWGSSESGSQIYVIRDVDGKVVPHSQLASILGGLDAPHSSVKAKMIDAICDGIVTEKQKTEAAELLNKSIGSIKKEFIYPASAEPGLLVDNDKPNFNKSTSKDVKREIARTTKVLGGDSASGGAGGVSVSKLEVYSFAKHIMLVGSAGSGKTFGLSKYVYSAIAAKTIDDYVEFDGHEGIEAVDMLGMQVPNSEGTLTWVDGPVTEAFRKASKGKKVILFVDEILRIPQRELSILVGSLTPRADGNYHIRTGRVAEVIDDIGVTEELIVSPDNLWVVAASNIGSGFAVDDMDTAFKDRFRTFRVDSSEDIVKSICGTAVKGAILSASEGKQLIQLFKDFQDIKKAGNLQKVLSTRHIAEVIRLKELKNEPLYSSLVDLEYTVLSVNSTGLVNGAEAEIWEKLTAPFS